MSNMRYKIRTDKITSSDVFTEASREELRVLLALISTDGQAVDEEELARLSGVSRTRAVSSLALWEEAGVISDADERTVTEEFADVHNDDDVLEHESVSVAQSIRDDNLASMLSECAALMEKAALSTQEIKTVCVLNTEYALSPEYIITLAAHIAAKGKLTAVRLRDDGRRLVSKGIDTLEALEQYIFERESETADEWEMRRAIGIYNRNLTPSEREYFKKWSGEFGYSVNIVTLAFDVCVLNTGKLSFQYMDTLLGAWHAAGCKTLEECRSANAAHKAQQDAKDAAKPGRPRTKSETPKPRYGDFDINEAFKHALSRSFGDDSE